MSSSEGALESTLDSGHGKKDPWGRLREAFGYAFTKSDPDSPQPPVPQELKQWGEFTAISLGFGIAYSGIREWNKVRQLPAVEYPEHAVNKAQAARLIAEENTLRVLRVQRAAVRGGVHVGTLAGIFFATQISSQYARETRDVWNIVLGGGVAGAVAGIMLPYTFLQRLGTTLAWSAAGAAVSYPTGLAQLKLEELSHSMAKSAGLDVGEAPGSSREQRPAARVEVVSGVYLPVLPQSRDGTTEDVIKALERSLERQSSEAHQATLSGASPQGSSSSGSGKNEDKGAGGGGWGWLWPFGQSSGGGKDPQEQQQASTALEGDVPPTAAAPPDDEGGRARKASEHIKPDYNAWPFNLRGRG